MFRKKMIEKKIDHDFIRWRLHEPARIEAFSDAVMAFAVTLLVVSLEVPKTFEEMMMSLQGVFGFAICFLLLMFIWYDQYLFFRRYGLQDTRTVAYNAMLVFVLLVFVYPLKFLFSYLTQGNDVMINGKIAQRFTDGNQVGELMILYSAGYIIINVLFVMMHKQALKKREQIKLLPIEVFNTVTFIQVYIGQIGLGLVSIGMAFLGMYYLPVFLALSGMIYSTTGIIISVVHKKRKAKMTAQFSLEEIESLHHPIHIKNTQ